MAVSVETLKGLERKINVTLPSDKIETEVNERLQKAAGQAKIDGFRPGKAPLHLIKQRFAKDFRVDVIRELLQPSLFDALEEQSLNPVGMPQIEPGPIEANKDFDYSARFEVFPEFEIKLLDESELELVQAEVTEKDVEATLEKLRKQHIEWKDVKRKAKKGDKLIVDFDIYDGEESLGEKGQARDFEIILGEGHIVPALEKALVGGEKDSTDDYLVEFPENWHDKAFSGKKLTFKLTIKNVLAGDLPALDEAFAEKLNVKEGGIEALKKDVMGHMARELERRVNEMNRESIFDAFLKQNPFELPNTLVQEEIKHLKHEFFHQVFGQEHTDDEQIPDFPSEMFEERAKRRVHLGLLFSEYVKKEGIKADKERVEAMIEKSAEAYDSPETVKAWYHEDSKRMAELEALVIEETATEKLIENCKVTHKSMDYDSVINPESKAAASEESEKKPAKDAKKKTESAKDDTGESA